MHRAPVVDNPPPRIVQLLRHNINDFRNVSWRCYLGCFDPPLLINDYASAADAWRKQRADYETLLKMHQVHAEDALNPGVICHGIILSFRPISPRFPVFPHSAVLVLLSFLLTVMLLIRTPVTQ